MRFPTHKQQRTARSGLSQRDAHTPVESGGPWVWGGVGWWGWGVSGEDLEVWDVEQLGGWTRRRIKSRV